MILGLDGARNNSNSEGGKRRAKEGFPECRERIGKGVEKAKEKSANFFAVLRERV